MPDPVTTVAFSPPPARDRPRWHGADLVEFTRYTAIDVTADDRGNQIERRALSFNTLKPASSLDDLFQYWQWLSSATDRRLTDLDVVQLMRTRIIGRLHLVDVGSSDPADFRFDLVGEAIPLKLPARPSTLPVAIYADATMRDYNTVRLTDAPRLQRIRGRMEGTGYHYIRLILPLLDKRRRVSHLAVAIERGPGDGMSLAPRFAG